MRFQIIAAATIACAMPFVASAQAAPAPAPAAAVTPAVTAAAAAMTTATATVGDLLDNPAARSVVQKHLPELVASDQIDMARGMTLKDVQAYATDTVTDAKLSAIDHDLAALKK